MSALQRGSIAIVGAAESDLGKVAEGMSPADLMAQATVRALADCGLKLGDIDGLFGAASQMRNPTLQLREYLGIRPRYQDGTHIGGTSFQSHLIRAQAAIEAGLCNVALIAYGSTQRSVGRAQASPRESNPYETPYRPFLPSSAYALSASRHMHLYGTTREQLAAVAVEARRWAGLNPQAWHREPLTIEDVLNAKMVSHPFTVRDICLVTDGGGALIVTSAARARTLAKPPVFVLGSGECLSHHSISSMPDVTVTPAAFSGPKAFEMAGLGPSDIGVLGLYDAFTINPIMFLEDLGFCPKGEGGPCFVDQATGTDSSLKINTNGGGLSYCHPGMYGIFLLIEAVRQLRGERGPAQVEDCQTALVHGNGVVYSAGTTVILGTGDSL
ncbi:acetyl-CoA acetyltransferase [Pigmentiphaga kullae]|uniref:Acetyl-CoA acetyltransferase n=1 Tax=Pigmentiphaga kullae TaxID=151784 RepID=A0A4Q7NNS4_9BURK|nr:acetyl-CoA acetyltransferase [Pigmentiphaga kullae]RZS86668.1 acetyl-CoA acetyltransferase [Pigmentiphaga kullae]